jgi:hypothetical protein
VALGKRQHLGQPIPAGALPVGHAPASGYEAQLLVCGAFGLLPEERPIVFLTAVRQEAQHPGVRFFEAPEVARARWVSSSNRPDQQVASNGTRSPSGADAGSGPRRGLRFASAGALRVSRASERSAIARTCSRTAVAQTNSWCSPPASGWARPSSNRHIDGSLSALVSSVGFRLPPAAQASTQAGGTEDC